MNWRSGKIRFSLVSILVAFLLLGVMTADAQADGRTEVFEGVGSGTSEITNPDECSDTGECRVEFEGEFDAVDIGSGTARFRFVDDMSGVSSQSGSCSVPAPGVNNFVWETTEGDVLIMTQTIGFICPSDENGIGYWKRFLQVKAGTGRFQGAKGSVFISGSRVLETGKETWTFEGDIGLSISKEQHNGCYRAYFVGNLIVIPPKNAPRPLSSAIMFWLCGNDITLGGPNPREDYHIFNPQE